MSEYEPVVLGTILDPLSVDGYALTAALGSLKPDDFEDRLCRAVFRAMRALHEADTPVDILTLQEYFTKNPDQELMAQQIAGFLFECSGQKGSVARNIHHYVKEVAKTAEERRMKEILRYALDRTEEGSLQEAIDTITKGQERLARIARPLPTMAEELGELSERLLDRKKADRPIPTFSETLNRNLNGGLQRERFMVLTAPAGWGKTTFALQVLEEIARAGIPCLFVALEMSKKELLTKTLSRLGGFNSGVIEGQAYLKDESEESKGVLEKVGNALGVYRNDYAANMMIWESEVDLTVTQIQAEVTKIQYQRMHQQELEELPPVVVCVDPLHALSTGRSELDADPIGKAGRIAGDLKRLARALDIPVVGLSDTTKEATVRAEAGGRIGQTGYRYSYEIAHRADVTGEIRIGGKLANVVLGKKEKKDEEPDKTRLRAHYQNIEKTDPLEDFADGEAIYAVLDLSKQRSGAKHTAYFVYERAFNKFTEIGVSKDVPF